MSPSIVLGLLLGSLYGLLWHACLGRRALWLPINWALGIGGFFGGYAFAAATGMTLLSLGAVPLPEATVGAFLALALLWLLIGRRVGRTMPSAV
jgi:hypothetical protein